MSDLYADTQRRIEEELRAAEALQRAATRALAQARAAHRNAESRRERRRGIQGDRGNR